MGSEFIDRVENNRVDRVTLSSDRTQARVPNPEGGAPQLVNLPNDPDLINILSENKVDIAIQPPNDEGVWVRVATSFLLPILLLVGLFFLLRRAQSGPGSQAMNFGKSKARVQMEPQTQVTFGDVAGIEQAKLELTEVVDFLKNADRFTAIGAKIPKGVLLVGPPGTGKTPLAKAVAGEAGVPFFSISGSEFVEMLVGVGASRVRDLFEQAKTNAPCIVFIDEIDAVGRQRGAGLGGGNDEREQTLNQLLTEMDGFEGNTGIIVVAATNRIDVLDAALLRPGRFDRQITVNLPDVKGRLEILKIHARNKEFDAQVNLENLARRTTGFSGADLKNVLNEASILAARNGETIIIKEYINNAIERIIAGLEKSALADIKNKRLLAYHEAGHAITATLLDYHDPVEKLTVIPRGQAGGLTWFTPVEDQGLISQKQILARITGALGGRAAEKIIFGESEVTTGASSDIIQVTSLARQLVTRYGMSKIGPQALDAGRTPIFIDGNFTNQSRLSQETAIKVDEAVKEIVMNCEQ